MGLERRVCPGCKSSMGRVFARAVELDFCQFCGGVWFDSGEVKALTGKLESLDDPGPMDLSCPDCQKPMERGSLAGCPVERCLACSGTYVPPDTLDRLAGEHVRMLPSPDSIHHHESLEFECPGCGRRLPFAEGVTTARGLCCWRCQGQIEELENPSTLTPAPVGDNGLDIMAADVMGGPRPAYSRQLSPQLLDVDRDTRSENEVLHSPLLNLLTGFVRMFLGV